MSEYEKVMCVTTFSDKGYVDYGKTMVESFDKHWAKDIDLLVYSDSAFDLPSSRVHNFPLSDYPKIQAFTTRHEHNPTAHGREQHSFWADKERKTGYSFKYDAVRFHYSAMVPYYAAQHFLSKHKKGILIFLDGDIVTTDHVDHDWLNIIFPPLKKVAYLGRTGGKSSETGFVAYRLPYAMKFLQAYHDVYDIDDIFNMGETANAYIFDRLLRLNFGQSKLYNLTPNRKKSHIWFVSPLNDKMIHLKGEANKAAGKPVIT